MPDEYISRAKALADFEACNAENPRWTPQRVKTLLLRQHAADVAEVCFLTELHVGDRAWKKAMSILDKKYAEAKKLPFIRDPLAWALYHTWKEFDDGKRCD